MQKANCRASLTETLMDLVGYGAMSHHHWDKKCIAVLNHCKFIFASNTLFEWGEVEKLQKILACSNLNSTVGETCEQRLLWFSQHHSKSQVEMLHVAAYVWNGLMLQNLLQWSRTYNINLINVFCNSEGCKPTSSPLLSCSISREDNLLYVDSVIATEDSLCSPLFLKHPRTSNSSGSL